MRANHIKSSKAFGRHEYSHRSYSISQFSPRVSTLLSVGLALDMQLFPTRSNWPPVSLILAKQSMINDRVVVGDHILRCIDVVHTWACYHATVTAKGENKET